MEAGNLKSQHDDDYNPQIPKKHKLTTLRARIQRLKLCCKTSFDASGYINILRTNYNYRLYFISHLCQHAGDWFVVVASLLTIDRLNGSATALSFYVLTEKIPPVLLSPLGGIISDSYDKRKLMIFYDSVAKNDRKHRTIDYSTEIVANLFGNYKYYTDMHHIIY